jgi:hypothetical protein
VGNRKLGGWEELHFLAIRPQQPAMVAGAAKTGIGLIDGIGKQPITTFTAKFLSGSSEAIPRLGGETQDRLTLGPAGHQPCQQIGHLLPTRRPGLPKLLLAELVGHGRHPAVIGNSCGHGDGIHLPLGHAKGRLHLGSCLHRRADQTL